MGKKENYNSGEVSIISSDVKIEGKVVSKGNVRVDGTIIGNIEVDGNLTLGESAKVQGDVQAMNIILSGEINGSVKASEKMVLESKSRLKGDLYAKRLVIEEGAIFDGKSAMNLNNSQVAESAQTRE